VERDQFSLGVQGERWFPAKNALIVPISDTGFHIFVCSVADGYRIYTMQDDIFEKDFLMVAILVNHLREKMTRINKGQTK